jgi:hypothetical protein
MLEAMTRPFEIVHDTEDFKQEREAVKLLSRSCVTSHSLAENIIVVATDEGSCT